MSRAPLDGGQGSRILASVPDRATTVLMRFSRLVADGAARDEIVPLLADTAVELAEADAAVVLLLDDDGDARVKASRGAPAAVDALVVEPETIGPELGAAVRKACGDEFAVARVRALATGGSLVGAVVILYRDATREVEEHLEVANAIVELAAVAMHNAARVEELRKAHATLRASQAAILRTEKLTALGQMAAGVAHDLKNILNPISLHLQVLKRAAARGQADTVKEGIEEMQQIVKRGVETVERMRDFSRQTPEVKLETVDVDRLVREAADLAKPRMASRKGCLNTIVLELGGPKAIQARSAEVLSALVNLVVNAIDAMPDGGTITVRTRAERDGTVIEIADDGPGMSPDVEKRVFEPFFTTKGDAGTGLGLAMVYACVQRHGGSVSLVTSPGHGTTFTLWFPAKT